MPAISFASIDFEGFHTDELPRRIAGGNGRLAAADVEGVGPIAFRVPDGLAFTYVPIDGGVEIRPDDADAGTVVTMARDDFSDFVNELRTCFGLLYAGRIDIERGDFAWLERWEPALRALYDARPIVDPAKMDLPVDLTRSFSLDGEDADLAAFLTATGFLHVRGVFEADELVALDADVERGRAAARPDDGRSWWATRANGTEVCCRLIYLGEQSARVLALADDARLRRLAALGGADLEPETDCLDGQSVVIKHPEISAGLSDLPWHRDCGLGGHPVLCPTVAIGIQLDRASAATGELHFLAGSHLGSSHPLQPGDEARQPVVAIETEPGDVTVHFGHVLHAAPPPTGDGPGRRALYVTFTRPETMEFVGPGNGYNDVLFEHDGQVRSVDEIRAGT